jgi:hypothetical protein
MSEPCKADYAYETIEDYEEIVGFKVNEAFWIGWWMARTTKATLDMPRRPGSEGGENGNINA